MGCIDKPAAMRLPRLWPRRGGSLTNNGPEGAAVEAMSPLLEAGQLLRQRREERGLSMRDLSRETRITTPVLEALERGWSDRLPEAAYLGTMLVQLERHLELPASSLQGALPANQANRLRGPGRRTSRFTLGSIDIISTWQGGVVYGVVMLGTLAMLNQQQRYLAQRNSQQLAPIPPSANDLQINRQQNLLNPGIPGLRPLDDARRQPLSQWLPPSPATNREGSRSNRIGLLRLNLSQPSTIRLTSAGGDRSELSGSQGRLTLQLQAPVNLSVAPPPEETDQVLWDGEPQQSIEGTPGVYRLPQAAPLSP